MTKKFDHAVIYNGKFYPANTPIEVKETKEDKKGKKVGAKNDDNNGTV